VVRTVHCADCGLQLEWNGLGRPKLRCPEHLKEHNLKMSRCRYASNVASDPELARERWRAGYRRNAERIRAQKLDQHYRKRYGMTAVEVAALREARSGLCEICDQPARGGTGRGPHRSLHVDHCHKSGKFRGLLCSNCNTMLGLAGEDPARLQAGIDYLTKFAAAERSA